MCQTFAAVKFPSWFITNVTADVTVAVLVTNVMEMHTCSHFLAHLHYCISSSRTNRANLRTITNLFQRMWLKVTAAAQVRRENCAFHVSHLTHL